jgi:hypothetical protein
MCHQAFSSSIGTRSLVLGHDPPKWRRLEQKRAGHALWSLVTPCRDGGAFGAIDEGLGCWDNIVMRSRGPIDTELASMLMPPHKAQQDGKARPLALQVEALLGQVPQMAKAIGGRGNWDWPASVMFFMYREWRTGGHGVQGRGQGRTSRGCWYKLNAH